MRNTVVVTVLSILLLSGCHAWRRDPAALIRAYDARARIQLWSGGGASLVHGVRVSRDSLVAVPIEVPPDSVQYAIRLPISLVDSIRTQRPDESRTLILLYALSGFIAVVVVGNALAEASET